jgi:hypothetical protein
LLAGALTVKQKMGGFKGYHLLAGADDTIIAVSLFTRPPLTRGGRGSILALVELQWRPVNATAVLPY